MALGSIGGNARVVVDFVANTSGLSSGLSQAGTQAQSTGSRLKGMGKAGLVAAGAAGLGALVASTKIGIDELSEASKVTAQTEAAIKSTGGAAGRSAKQIGELASSLSAKTGIDDEVIQSGENILLTFKKIKGVNFDRATKGALDLSVALGTDMTTASMQLGKALNDPVKGVGRLAKAGVDFAPAQKAMIERMVETGDVAGAQRIILKELESQVGGSAEAYGNTVPGQIDKAKNAFAEISASILQTFVPAMQAVTKFATEHPKIFKALVIAIFAVAGALVALNFVMGITAALGITISAPFLLIAAGIVVLIAAIVLCIKYWDQIKAAMVAVFEWVKANWPLLLAILTGPIGLAVKAIIDHWDTIRDGTVAVWNAIKSALSGAVNAVANVIRSVWNGIVSFLGAIAGRIASVFDAVRNWLRRPGEWAHEAADAIRSAWNAVIGFLSGIPGRIAGIFDGLRSWLKRPGQWAEEGVDAVKHAFNGMVSFLSGLVGRVSGIMQSVANAIKAPINAVVSAWNALAIPRVSISIPKIKVLGKSIGGGSFGFGPFAFPDMPHLARGGVVSSPTIAMVGEGAGREIVAPEGLLREIVGSGAPEVRVFIGDEELRGLVRYEVRNANDRVAQTLLAGLRR